MEQTITEPETERLGSEPTTLHMIRIVAENARAPKRKATVVLPADTYVGIGHSVTFFTKDTEAIIFFPNPVKLFGQDKPILRITPDKPTDPLIIAESAGAPGTEYPYTVYCHETDDFADVGSAPRFIIE